MAGRRAKIGLTCIVFGILWIPIWVVVLKPGLEFLLKAFGASGYFSVDIAFGMLCVPPILLLLGGLVSFLMDDD